MTKFDPRHHNFGGPKAATETLSEQIRQPEVRHTADGLEADLPARADYDLELLTVEQAATGTIVADGGSELEVMISLCGGCEQTFDRDKASTGYVIEATGERVTFDEPRCPHCGTSVWSDRTQTKTVTFKMLEEAAQ